ncbi:PKD domain-containing protein [Mucilaginibacter litoreus]|uniref:PKD domain-containing protein n=1 Tax=Mucilaginibacter litoreus TaxID=1048221 RepID=A0ABW3ATF6_9SPHI
MVKTFTKSLFFLPIFVLATMAVWAQSITIGTINPGPYGRGSTISVPVKITGCINDTTNVYSLYLSDANGNFGSQKLIGTFQGFYATFINGVVPSDASITTSSNYKVRVTSSKPAITSTASAAFQIQATAGIKAGTSSTQINAGVDPEAFGSCSGIAQNFTFTNTSEGGNAATATFFNELTQASEGTFNLNTTFPAKAANYTVTVKTQTSSGIIGTKSYQLINNVANNSFTITGNGTVCLGAGNTLDYNVDITTDNGIQKNYPGLIYKITWGDSTSNIYTLCDIAAANGKVSHMFLTSSCGSNPNGRKNVFQIDIQPKSRYCSNITQPVTTYARVLAPPENTFDYPETACLKTPVSFANTSEPGDDPNSAGISCKNDNVRYTWMVDGVVKVTGYRLDQPFVYTFSSNGIHTVTLHLENNGVICTAADKTHEICIQNPPVPAFDLPAQACISSGAVSPVNNSTVDNICNTPVTYNWVLVSGPANGVNYTASAQNPSFNFSKTGIYQFRLDITTSSCGTVKGPVKQIVVNTTPTAVMSPTTTQCGKGVTLSFDPTAVSTKTTLDGTAQPSPTTYTWSVTSADNGTFAFASGSDEHSQYPRITFNDYATYVVTVTHTNNCGGPVTASQIISFVPSPTVSAGQPQTVCEGEIVTLNGSPGPGGNIASVKWTSPTGGTFSNPNGPNTTYTPSAADIANGSVMLTYTATTSLAPPCNQIPSTVTITIIPKAVITSPNAESVCSGTNFNYTITSPTATSFNWTATLTSGIATGFGATGSGNTINDLITNTGTTNAVITYTITPNNGTCTGTPFKLTLTVKPLPVVTATAAEPEICSGQPANISLSSNVSATTYTWTSTSTAGVTGHTSQNTPVTATKINDILTNTGNANGTVTYVITPYNGTCPGTAVTVTVTVRPGPKTSDPGPDNVICNQPTYTLQGNDPAPANGKWTITSGQSGVTFSDNTDPNAVVSGLQPGQVYKFTWTITAAPTCPSSANTVTITVSPQVVGGTTASATGVNTVCAGANSDKINLTGYTGNIVRWEQSVNNGSNWTTIANTTSTITYTNLTQTTLFRAIVESGACGSQSSSATTITVNPQVTTAAAGNDQTLCDGTTATLQGNDPGQFAGEWTQISGPVVTIVNPANAQTQITGLAGGNVYTFRWTIKGIPPCADSFDEVTITDNSNVQANFTTQNQVCGNVAVTFNNTSAPSLPGTVYDWNFGDGSSVSHEVNPTHTFKPNANGTDAQYHVILTIAGNCAASQHEEIITVSPSKPVAAITLQSAQACGTLNLTVQNTSPGTNYSYDYYLYDENHNVIDHVGPLLDKSDAVFPPHIPTKATTWYVQMIATNNCGVTNNTGFINISVSPSNIISRMQLKDGVDAVCVGNPVILQNTSVGGEKFEYKIYNASNNQITFFTAGTTDFPYTFASPGEYKITITASNAACGSAPESAPVNVKIYALPQPNFAYTQDVNNRVTFVNTTPPLDGVPATSLSYQWDFGDGSAIETGYTPAPHLFDYTKSPYTVKLTATNPATSCQRQISQTISIKFTGELFLPNAFQPASTQNELRTFKAKGQKLKEWNMQVFNKWGQLVWQTTALSGDGSPSEGWDGTFKGQPAPQGTYIWQATAKFQNGSEWKGMSYNGSLPKRSGVIYLIR